MNTGDQAPRAELTDQQLDALLDSADRELLDYIQASTDPDATLTAIMTDNRTPMSWAYGPGRADQITDIFLASLNRAIDDAKSAAAEARRYETVQQWRTQLQIRVSGVALGTSLIPGLHGGGIVIEFPYLLRLMGRGAIGAGELMGAKIEAEDDLLAIFALWSGAIDKSTLAAATGGVVIVDSVAYPVFGAKVLGLGFKIGVKAAATHAGTGSVPGAAIGHGTGAADNMLQQISAKTSAKISAKIGGRAYAKTLVDFVPCLGASVGVGVDLYTLNEFLASARIYYEHKIKDIRTPDLY